MNGYIKSIMDRDPAAKSKLSIILTYPGVLMVNQSFVLNCFFFKRMYNLPKLWKVIMKLLECISRAIINFFAYLILSLVAIYCLIFIANFLAGQTYTLTHGEYFLVWIVMAVFIRQVSGDISVLFFKKSEKE